MIKVVYYFFLFLIIVNCSIDYSSNIFRQKTKQKTMSKVSNLSVLANEQLIASKYAKEAIKKYNIDKDKPMPTKL